MNIDSIKNGTVIDHITAGKAMTLYRLLKLDSLDCPVAIIQRATSSKMGSRDIIKIDASIGVDMDILGYVDPNATVNIIRDGSWWRSGRWSFLGSSPTCCSAKIPAASPPRSRSCPTSSSSPTGKNGFTGASTAIRGRKR